MLLFSALLSMLVDLRPPPPPLPGHLSPPRVTASGGGLRAATPPPGPPPPPTRGDDDDLGNPEGESASGPPPDCSDPGPFILCRLADPGPPKRALSSP